MKIIPYGKQSIDEADVEAVISTLKSDYLTQGPKVREFEIKFAEYVRAKYAVAVSNATAGLHISVLALGLKPGERVITTPITFAATANCVRYASGEVWFADIDPDTYLLSLEKTRELIESKPKGFFKGIIPVDFAGLPVNMEDFKALANEHDLWIIEDACHAPGASYKDLEGVSVKAGTCKYADLAVFSFHPVKHIACGEGGMVTTNNKSLYDSLMRLRTHGITKENMLENHGAWFYEMQSLGFNYRLTDLQCALGITQLEKNNKGVVRRNEIAQMYKDAFEGIVKYQSLPDNSYNAHHLFVIEINNRKECYEFLHKNGILAQIHYIPVHKLPYYKKIGYIDANLENATNYYDKCISLPMFPSLTNEEVNYVINKTLSFLNKNTN
jgi:UDP-4-amino-4,6-dideoxy-N-acetyl-beta-L-altrosamine transaminase